MRSSYHEYLARETEWLELKHSLEILWIRLKKGYVLVGFTLPLREINRKRLITMTRDKYDSPSFFDECTGPISE